MNILLYIISNKFHPNNNNGTEIYCSFDLSLAYPSSGIYCSFDLPLAYPSSCSSSCSASAVSLAFSAFFLVAFSSFALSFCR